MKKHINLSSWKLPITDWTELNYVQGGLDAEYANIANVKGNYIKKSNNICYYDGTNRFYLNWGGQPSDINGAILKAFPIQQGDILYISIKNPVYHIAISFFDNNKTYISYSQSTNTSQYRVIAPENASYAFAWINYDSGTTITQELMDSLEVMGNVGLGFIDYQPYSTSGLYIEDNVNDELIPINDPEMLNRNLLSLSKSTSDALEDENLIDNKVIKDYVKSLTK